MAPRQPPNMRMASYEARIASFNVPTGPRRRPAGPSWPLPPHHSVTPESLARAGFYYAPTPTENDSVQCFHCHKVLGGWEAGDDALREHQAHMPVGQTPCPWVALCLLAEDAKEQRRTGRRILKDLSSSMLHEARMATFADEWPMDGRDDVKATSEALARAGFHYTPDPTPGSDATTCMLCDIILSGWAPEDDPWEEHRNRRPDCLFLNPKHHHKSSQSSLDALAPASTASSMGSKKRATKSKKATSDAPTDSSQPTKLSQAALRKQSVAALRKPREPTPTFAPTVKPASVRTVEISPPPPVPAKAAARKVAKTKRSAEDDEADTTDGPNLPSTVVPARVTRSASHQQQVAVSQSEPEAEVEATAPPKAKKPKLVRKKATTAKSKTKPAVVEPEPESVVEEVRTVVKAESIEPVPHKLESEHDVKATRMEHDAEMDVSKPEPAVVAPPVDVFATNSRGLTVLEQDMSLKAYLVQLKKQRIQALQEAFDRQLAEFDAKAATARNAMIDDFATAGFTIPADVRTRVA